MSRSSGDYEEETGNQIVSHFRNLELNPGKRKWCSSAVTAPSPGAKTGAKAVYNAVVLEELAKMASITLQANPDAPRLKEALRQKHYLTEAWARCVLRAETREPHTGDRIMDKSIFKHYEVWFVTGSQHLYGPETLAQVADDAKKIVEGLNVSGTLAVELVWKDTLKTTAEVTRLMREANSDDSCIGLVTWMHTFSPAKMWITGLSELNKPFCQLHTQYNRDIPWAPSIWTS